MNEVNYSELTKKAKQIAKRDRKAEADFIENKIQFQNYIQSFYSPHYSVCLNKVIELTQAGNEILVSKCYQSGQSMRLYYHLLPDELATEQDALRKQLQAQLDTEYKTKLDAVVAELAIEFEASEQARLEAESKARSDAIKQAILDTIMKGE